jgi:hypothetical protein
MSLHSILACFAKLSTATYICVVKHRKMEYSFDHYAYGIGKKMFIKCFNSWQARFKHRSIMIIYYRGKQCLVTLKMHVFVCHCFRMGQQTFLNTF